MAPTNRAHVGFHEGSCVLSLGACSGKSLPLPPSPSSPKAKGWFMIGWSKYGGFKITYFPFQDCCLGDHVSNFALWTNLCCFANNCVVAFVWMPWFLNYRYISLRLITLVYDFSFQNVQKLASEPFVSELSFWKCCFITLVSEPWLHNFRFRAPRGFRFRVGTGGPCTLLDKNPSRQRLVRENSITCIAQPIFKLIGMHPKVSGSRRTRLSEAEVDRTWIEWKKVWAMQSEMCNMYGSPGAPV